MSIDIDWRKISDESVIAESLRVFLDDHMKTISSPSFIDNLSVTRVSLGSIPPQITIRHIGDPFNDFYEADEPSEHNGEHSDEVKSSKEPSETNESLDSGILENDDDDDDDYDEDNEQEEFYEDNFISQQIERDSEALRSATDSTEISSPTPTLPSGNLTDVPSLLLSSNSNSMNYIHNLPQNMIGLGTPHHGTETPTLSLFHQNTLLQSSVSKQKIALNDKTNGRDESDIQILVEFNYEGDFEIEFSVNLLLNFPSPKFITLPIKLRVTELEIHSLAVIAYLKNSVCFAFLCDVCDADNDYFPLLLRTGSIAMGGTIVDYVNAANNRERIDIIKNVRIESEIGEMETNVLRNVGKVEKFLVDQIRSLLRQEIAWPNWICLDMNEDEGDEVNDNEDDNTFSSAGTEDFTSEKDKEKSEFETTN
ncbi:Mitochondrial distribution and morphology protein 12 [Scheffersomyces spartinae]|uniref:Mitochondrial distribution and morphology protein 12 n=1 Tax=Scheffersomyces spartinae TaxID=45513 RepID=A0A9P8AHF1_9ASCO|nr:Mitochondrial distribution and morphology protein 12 [Scheffersomyces spartinae]KAG7192628.1 Mitochondrial distribution and morphology protein 12 [Scheffersomyces spartinae]